MNEDPNVWGIVAEASAFMRGTLPKKETPGDREEIQIFSNRRKPPTRKVEVVRRSCGRFIRETIEI